MARELRRPAPAPELGPEQEIDLVYYAGKVAARWWLLVLGALAGVVAGYLLSLGGAQVYSAQALINLGEPVGPGGGRIIGVATANSVSEIVRSEAVIRRVAAKVDMTPAQLRKGVSVQSLSSPTARLAEAPLAHVTVKGPAPKKVAAASTELATIAVSRLSPYVKAKIANLNTQIAAMDKEIESLDERSDAATKAAEDLSLSPIERLIAVTNAGALEQRRAAVQQTQADRLQLLSFAQQVESPRLIERGAATKESARSRRNAIAVGAVLGLLAGLIAALAWDRVAALRPSR
jgi:hypothetical protein